MEEKIGIIKEKFASCKETELSAFIKQYQSDTRSGVAALCKRAQAKIDAYEKEMKRLEQMLAYEREYSAYGAICGIDEVGRGPLAGPVVAGAVILPRDCKIMYLNDSKKLSSKLRNQLYDEILSKAVAYGIAFVSHERIDEINILNATYEAMREAIEKCAIKPDILLNDAVTIPEIAIKQVPIIKGDAKSASIAAASVIAKVERDRYMEKMDQVYPGYGFASNKGYGSAEHIEALKKLGPCSIHRRSFIGNFVAL